jgi:hypothetical protein
MCIRVFIKLSALLRLYKYLRLYCVTYQKKEHHHPALLRSVHCSTPLSTAVVFLPFLKQFWEMNAVKIYFQVLTLTPHPIGHRMSHIMSVGVTYKEVAPIGLTRLPCRIRCILPSSFFLISFFLPSFSSIHQWRHW